MADTCDWVEAKDPATGRVYYANTKTKASSWTLPEELRLFREKALQKTPAVPETPATVLNSGAELLFAGQPAQQSHKQLDHEWVECFDPKYGRPYFHNKSTKETVWDRPAHLRNVPPATPATQQQSVEDLKSPPSSSPLDAAAAATPVSSSPMAAAASATPSSASPMADALSQSETAQSDPARPQTADPMQSSGASSVEVAQRPASTDGAKPASTDGAKGKKPVIDLKAAEKVSSAEAKDSPKAFGNPAFTPQKQKSLKRLLNIGTPRTNVVPPPLSPRDVVSKPDEVGKKVQAPMQANKALLQDITKFQIADFAQEHFALRRKAGNMKKGNLLKFMAKKAELSTMLTHSTTPIKRSLLKIKGDDYANEKAIKLFQHVLSYMGDGPNPKEGWNTTSNAKYILRRGLEMDVLRDEIYCQLCKQVTENPNTTSTVRGFHLMAMCSGCFPPSDQFVEHLREFLKAESVTPTDLPSVDKIPRAGTPTQSAPSINPLHANKMSDEKLAYAKYALERLEKILVTGPRLVVPGIAEINAVANRQEVLSTLEFLDNTSKTVPVSSFDSVADVISVVGRKMHISEDVVDQFGIWQVSNKGSEHYFNPSKKFLDILGQQELDKEDDNKLVYKLVFKKRLFLKNEQVPMRDPSLLHFVYIQAVNHVINGLYKIGVEDALKLAALQAHVDQGDLQPGQETSGFFVNNLDKYIPAALHKQKKPQEWDQQIVMLYKKLVGYKNTDTKAHYVNFLCKNPLYGSCFFPLEQKHIKDAPKDCVIAINARGAFLLRADTRDTVAKYEYAELCSWTFDDAGFQFVRGNIYKQETLSFGTPEGELVCSLFQYYVNDLINSEFGDPAY